MATDAQREYWDELGDEHRDGSSVQAHDAEERRLDQEDYLKQLEEAEEEPK